MEKTKEKPAAVSIPVVRDRNGTPVTAEERVILYDFAEQEDPITGVLVYDRAFWAYAVHGDNGKRYLLMDCLRTCVDPGDGGFAWKEIEVSNKEMRGGE